MRSGVSGRDGVNVMVDDAASAPYSVLMLLAFDRRRTPVARLATIWGCAVELSIFLAMKATSKHLPCLETDLRAASMAWFFSCSFVDEPTGMMAAIVSVTTSIIVARVSDGVTLLDCFSGSIQEALFMPPSPRGLLLLLLPLLLLPPTLLLRLLGTPLIAASAYDIFLRRSSLKVFSLTGHPLNVAG